MIVAEKNDEFLLPLSSMAIVFSIMSSPHCPLVGTPIRRSENPRLEADMHTLSSLRVWWWRRKFRLKPAFHSYGSGQATSLRGPELNNEEEERRVKHGWYWFGEGKGVRRWV